MKWTAIGCGTIVLLLGILAAIGVVVTPDKTDTEPVAEAESTAPARELEPVTYEWSGSGPLETETIELWQESVLKWKMEGATAPVFIVTVHDASGRMVGAPVNQTAPGEGETRIRGAGKRYLKVNSANCDWGIVLVTMR